MSTYSARYYLDTPGWGLDLPLMLDPQVRLQGWGANLSSHSLDISTELRGATHRLTRDNTYQNPMPASKILFGEQQYGTKDPFVEESRASHPAFAYRAIDNQYTRFEEPWLNPQDFDTNRPFTDNISTRILAKDAHVERAGAVHVHEPFASWLPKV